MEFIDRIIHALTVLYPLHPMLVHVPIALTGAGALLILLAAGTRKIAFEQAAFFNITLAALGTLAAGMTGIHDNVVNYDSAAPNGHTKVLLALILFLITSTTAIVRWRNPNLFESPAKPFYIAAYLLSFAIVLVLAFLGGVILYGF